MAEQVVRRGGKFLRVRTGCQHVEVGIALHRVGIDDLAAVLAGERDRQLCLAAGRGSVDEDRGTHCLGRFPRLQTCVPSFAVYAWPRPLIERMARPNATRRHVHDSYWPPHTDMTEPHALVLTLVSRDGDVAVLAAAAPGRTGDVADRSGAGWSVAEAAVTGGADLVAWLEAEAAARRRRLGDHAGGEPAQAAADLGHGLHHHRAGMPRRAGRLCGAEGGGLGNHRARDAGRTRFRRRAHPARGDAEGAGSFGAGGLPRASVCG